MATQETVAKEALTSVVKKVGANNKTTAALKIIADNTCQFKCAPASELFCINILLQPLVKKNYKPSISLCVKEAIPLRDNHSFKFLSWLIGVIVINCMTNYGRQLIIIN